MSGGWWDLNFRSVSFLCLCLNETNVHLIVFFFSLGSARITKEISLVMSSIIACSMVIHWTMLFDWSTLPFACVRWRWWNNNNNSNELSDWIRIGDESLIIDPVERVFLWNQSWLSSSSDQYRLIDQFNARSDRSLWWRSRGDDVSLVDTTKSSSISSIR